MLILQTSSAHRQDMVCTLLDRLVQAAPSENGLPGTPLSLVDIATCDYLLAVLDMLAWLGAVSLDREHQLIKVTAVQAGYLFRLLSDLVSCDAALVADWGREGLTAPERLRHPFGAGVDLLAALERRRRELLPAAAPVREVQAAVGLVMRQSLDGTLVYLLVYDAAARMWQLPGGRCEVQDSSPRTALLRELREELDLPYLHEPADVVLTAIGLPTSSQRESPTYGLLTRTIFHVFAVHFISDLPALRADLRWVSTAELRAGRTIDQQIISVPPPLCRLAYWYASNTTEQVPII